MIQYLSRVDHQLFEFIQEHIRCDLGDVVFLAIRDKFFWIPLYLFLISWMFFKYGTQTWKIAIAILVCIGITDQLNSSFIKSLVKRDRPCREIFFKEQFTPVIDCSGGYSFPSSHATNHMGLSTLLFFTCRRELKRWGLLLFLWALLIGWSQIYIGVHFPFDVLAGWLEGFVVGYLIYLVLKKMNKIPVQIIE